MNVKKQIDIFKKQLLKYEPFYGRFVVNLKFIENKKIETACTDGLTIQYNPNFFKDFETGQINYVMMHEILHVMLMHSSRRGQRNPRLWNVACDYEVNMMCDNLAYKNRQLDLKRPPVGLFCNYYNSASEAIYSILLKDNVNVSRAKNFIIVDSPNIFPKDENGHKLISVDHPLLTDVKVVDENDLEVEINGQIFKSLLKDIYNKTKNAGQLDNLIIRKFDVFFGKPTINWKTLLKGYMEEGLSDETSYTTPERKYIHMDMLLPGYGISEVEVDDIWVMIDSSGSISNNDMSVFLTEVYSLLKGYASSLNIAYWNTEVSDVYKNITDRKKLSECLPSKSGGTNINCVFKWLKEEKIDPNLLIILTDGYFGRLEDELKNNKLKRKTIIVLNDLTCDLSAVREVGKYSAL